jgi:hypothetical protein
MSTSVQTRRPRRALNRTFLLCAAAHLLPLLAHAQSAGSVAGVVADAATHAPLKGATAMLRDAADSSAKPLGAITDAAGAFTIDHAALGRSYRLEISYVGYDRKLVEGLTLTAEKPHRNLGTIELRQGAVDLNEVKVTSERDQVQVKADKTVYGVENNPAYTASNVSELLGQIPSVSVDQDGKVSLRGKENVTIMMNDRPLTMPADQLYKYLQALPATMVKEIEVRTNPGAKYDAKYDGGIINIVTRRTASDMFGGNINVGGDSRPSYNGGAGLYYNGGGLNASIDGGIYRGSNSSTNQGLRENYRATLERVDNGIGGAASSSTSYYGGGQVDYKVSENDLASLSFNLSNWNSTYTSHGVHELYNADGELATRFYDTSRPIGDVGNDGGFNSASLLLRHTFAKDHSLSLDVSYNSNVYDGTFGYTSNYYHANGEFDSLRSTDRNSIYNEKNTSVITTLDYENALSDAVTMSIGGKSEINKLDNETEVSNRDHLTSVFVPDTIQSNHYLPDNSVYAAYGSVSVRVIQPLSVTAGLRFESANVSAKYASGAELVSRDYANIFPSG